MLQRLAAAWQVLRGAELPPQLPVTSNLFPGRALGVYQVKRRERADQQLSAYQAWVAAAVNVISMAIRQNEWCLCRQIGDDREDIEKLPPEQVPDLLKMPDRFFDLGSWLELSTKHLDTTGSAYWYKITRDPNDPFSELIGLQIIYPDQILPHFNRAGVAFTEWEVTIPGSPMQLVPVEDVIWTYRPHPALPYYGASPVEQVALSHDLDLFAKAYSVSQLEGGGLPPGLLSVEKQKLTEEDVELVKARWRKQRQNPEDIGVLGANAKWQTIGTSLQDLEWLALSRMTRDQVLSIYGVPAAKIGLVEDVNRANAVDVNRSFAADAVRPRLMLFEQSINLHIMPLLGLGDDVMFRFDNPVEEDMAAAVTRANEALDRGAITVNEYRIETGREDIGENGDVYSMVGGRRIVAELEPVAEDGGELVNPQAPAEEPGQGEQDEARALPHYHQTNIVALAAPTGQQSPPILELKSADDLGLAGLNRDEVIRTLQLRGALPDIMPVTQREHQQTARAFENVQLQLEQKFLKQLRQLISAEQRQVVKAIRNRKTIPTISSRAIPASEFEGDDLEIVELDLDLDAKRTIFEDLVDFGPQDDWEALHKRDLLGSVWERQVKSWRNTYERMLRQGMRDGWELLDEEVGRSLLPVEPALEQSSTRIGNTAARMVRRFRRTTRRTIARAIRKLFELHRKEGVDTTVDDVAEEVSRTYDQIKGGRAETNARTDTATAVNDGKNRHMRAAERRLPVTFIATWNAILDEVVRPAHARAHTQEREVPQPFDVGGEQLRYPGDPRGSAGNTINCRCTTTVQMTERSDSDD